MGRFWQSLILRKLNPVFQYLPVETMVHDNQMLYYKAIGDSTHATDCGPFIDFMLGERLNALKVHKGNPISTVSGTVNESLDRVLTYIVENPGLRTNAISAALNIPIRTLRRYLKQLSVDKIEFIGAARTGGYFPKK